MPRRPPPRHSVSFVSAVTSAGIALALVVVAAGEAHAGSSYFISRANSARSSNGLSSYSVASDLSAIAARHARSMASRRSIYHNSSLASEACCWRSIGENVGAGQSESSIQNAFMSSSAHRANILSSTFNEIGVGTARGSDGKVYVDEVFRARTGSHGSTRKVTRSTSTTHRSSSSTGTSRPRAAAPAPRKPSAAALLARKLQELSAARGTQPDPVAAALSFNVMMSRLTH
jgi:hypothetical protein